MTIPTVATPRLFLRAFTQADIEPLHRILGEKDILQYFPNPEPPTVERVRKIITDQLKHWDEHGYGWWAMELRGGSELIGWCGLGFLPETNEDEVAYLLAKSCWGRGLATEAAKASVRYGFEAVGLESLVAIVHPENIASRRVIEKLGMTLDGRSLYWGMECFHYTLRRPAFVASPAAPSLLRFASGDTPPDA